MTNQEDNVDKRNYSSRDKSKNRLFIHLFRRGCKARHWRRSVDAHHTMCVSKRD